MFSALAEQCRRLDAAGVPYDLCPGVPAYAAAAAALGRELTVPTVAQTVTLTRISALATPMPDGEGLAELGRSAGTLVLHLSVHRIDEVVAQLVGVYGPDCPAAVVAHVTHPQEIVLRGRLDALPAAVHEAGIRMAAVVIVGPGAGGGALPGQPPVLGRAMPILISGTALVLILGGTAEARALAARARGRGRPGGVVAGRAGARPRPARRRGPDRRVRRRRRARRLARARTTRRRSSTPRTPSRRR